MDYCTSLISTTLEEIFIISRNGGIALYAFILKNCLLQNKIEYFTSEKDCYVRQINPLGEKSNIKKIIYFLQNEQIIKFKSEKAINNFIKKQSKKFKLATPCSLVVVNREYKYEFIENTILILSYFQRFPAELFAVIGLDDEHKGFEFYPSHSFPSFKTIYPNKFSDFYSLFNDYIGKYKYILKLFFEANSEKEPGYKIAKYYSILEVLSGGVGYKKVKKYLKEQENNQPLVPDKFKVDLSEYKGMLLDYIIDKNGYSYLELMAAYRHLVVHFGELHPAAIRNCFDSDQDMIFLIQAVVENLIRQAILAEVEKKS